MLTIEEIQEAFKDQHTMSGHVPMTSLATLGNFTDCKLLMDEDSFDYYYALDVKKLTESMVDKNCLKDLVSDGWSLSEDKTQIIKYLKNFT